MACRMRRHRMAGRPARAGCTPRLRVRAGHRVRAGLRAAGSLRVRVGHVRARARRTAGTRIPGRRAGVIRTAGRAGRCRTADRRIRAGRTPGLRMQVRPAVPGCRQVLPMALARGRSGSPGCPTGGGCRREPIACTGHRGLALREAAALPAGSTGRAAKTRTREARSPTQAAEVGRVPRPADPVRADPVRADPVRADPVRADPVRAVLDRVDTRPRRAGRERRGGSIRGRGRGTRGRTGEPGRRSRAGR